MKAARAVIAPATATRAAIRGHGAFTQRRCECGKQTSAEHCPRCSTLLLQRRGVGVGSTDDPLEREADRAADAVIAGRSVDRTLSTADGSRVQRSAVYVREQVGTSSRFKTGPLQDWDYVVYEDHVKVGNRVFDKNTGQVIGSWPWLTNNPGDITVDPKEAGKSRSALNRAFEWKAVKGKAASTGHILLAIFPDMPTGGEALKKLFAEPDYRDKTLAGAIEQHLGRKESRVPGVDDPVKYLERVKKRAHELGVKDELLSKTMSELASAGVLDQLVSGFGVAEGVENVGATYRCNGRDKTDDPKIPKTVRDLRLFKSLPDEAPDEVLRLLGCTVRARDVQRKAAPVADEAVAPRVVDDVLSTHGEEIDPRTRQMMEARFGHDFGRVRVHADAHADRSARSIGALAYTAGPHIVFAAGRYAPDSRTGQHLLAHELAHVVQQSRAVAPVLRRQPVPDKDKNKPGKFYQEVIDNIAYADREMNERRKQGGLSFAPLNYDSLKALLALCEAVDQNARDVVPTRLDALLKRGVMVPFHTISEELLAELAARVHEMGLESDAQRLRKAYADDQRSFSIANVDSGAGQRDVKFYTRLVDGAISAASIETPTRLEASIHQFVRAFVPLRDAYVAIDWEALAWEKRSGHSFRVLRPGMSHEEWYNAVRGQIERWLGGLEGLIQQAIDAARGDFENNGGTGNGSALLLGLRNAMTKELREALFPREAGKDISSEQFNTTRTTLTKGKGFIADAFAKDADKKKRRVAITTYDPEQERVQEMSSSLAMLYNKRLDQIAVLGRIYGAMDLVPRQLGGEMEDEARENAESISKLKDGRLRLDSDDDWREFVLQKYKDLTNPAPPQSGAQPVKLLKRSPAQALRAIMDVLFLYLRNFTMHAHYTNIYDIGDSYLNKPFPRALSGQLVHDCGVYAVRAAYILSLVRTELTELKLNFRFVFMPAHVGLVIEGNGLPTYFIQNDSFLEVSPQSMENAKQNFENFTQTKSIVASDATATITAEVQVRPPGKRDHTQLLGELSAGRFIPEGADMPVRVVDIPAGTTAESSARQLWKTYEANASKGLFGPAVSNKNDPGYLFHQRYLALIEERRKQYNELTVPFWNVAGPDAWDDLRDSMKKTKGEATAATLLAPVRAYASIITKGIDELDHANKRIGDLAKSISSSLASNPKLHKPDSRIAVGERALSLFESNTQLQDYRNQVAGVIRELAAKPDAQWKVDDLLKRLQPPFAPPVGVPKRPLE